MVTLACAAPDFLLERQVLLAPKHEQIADGSIRIGAMQHDAFCDLETGFQGDWVRWSPAYGKHSPYQLISLADHSDIEGITRDAFGIERHLRGDILLFRFISFYLEPDKWQKQVCHKQKRSQDHTKNRYGNSDSRSSMYVFS
jgi:hypothetical protein